MEIPCPQQTAGPYHELILKMCVSLAGRNAIFMVTNWVSWYGNAHRWTWRYDDMIIIYQSRAILGWMCWWLCWCPSAVCGFTPFDHKVRRRVSKRAACGFPGNQLTWNPIFSRDQHQNKLYCSCIMVLESLYLGLCAQGWHQLGYQVLISGCFNCRDLSRSCFAVRRQWSRPIPIDD